jgi:hypothetical protein
MPSISQILSWAQSRGRAPKDDTFEGTIVKDTWNPTDGSVQVVVGESFANFNDPDQLPYAITGQVMTLMLGLRGGPIGGERVLAIRVGGGFRFLMEENFDDAVGAPSGELWYRHYKPGTVGADNTPVSDSGFKVTNDGPTAGDGLGGFHAGLEGAHSTVDTASGHQLELNDTTETVTAKSAGGHSVELDDITKAITASAIGGAVKTIWDGNGNALSHIVPSSGGILALGDLAANLGTTKAAINQDIMNDAAAGYKKIITDFGNSNFIQFAAAIQTAAAGHGADVMAMAAALVAAVVGNWVSPIADVSGSSIVRIAS